MVSFAAMLHAVQAAEAAAVVEAAAVAVAEVVVVAVQYFCKTSCCRESPG